jgi:hypothetical protein
MRLIAALQAPDSSIKPNSENKAIWTCWGVESPAVWF